jgi:two-component system chemotaxis response regulator CheY
MSKRILVADDALIIREIIKDRAREAGFEVVGEAINGKDAYEKFCALRPDVTTLDLVMPEYDGLYGLGEIMKSHPDAKVVVVSALDQKDVLKQAFRLGAADFVVKPFDHAILIETLERVIA